jgi:DNA-binding transcriptional MerR regulator
MAEISQVEIPNRPLFKAAEVCELAKLQPYVLRSWEAEFKDLGVARNGSTTRVYRRVDIERVLRIKHLLLVDGLTLAGVRRKLDEEAEPPLDLGEPEPTPGTQGFSADARQRIGHVKRGLQSLLALLDGAPQAAAGTAPTQTQLALASPDAIEAEEKAAPAGEPAKSASPRRKRSA